MPETSTRALAGVGSPNRAFSPSEAGGPPGLAPGSDHTGMAEYATAPPGQVGVQFGVDLINILITGRHTTFLADRAAPGGFKIHPDRPADCSQRAYGDFGKSIKVFLTCEFVGHFTR
ncbi:hypothetical protein [Actinomadura litoris]|uniref:hypothetical protein n=1 Tax=Actinomadura litoris TaxID=2678616 RepID=UPI0012E2F879|nr:hypothetical protein [Actinomadura litoris]